MADYIGPQRPRPARLYRLHGKGCHTEGNIVGMDIDHASQKLDFKSLKAISLPTLTTKLA